MNAILSQGRGKRGPKPVLFLILDQAEASSKYHTDRSTWVQLWLLRTRPMAAMASTGRGTKAVNHQEGIDPCKCHAHCCECVYQ